MGDVMSHVSKLSLVFQMAEVDFSNVKPLIDSCIKALKNLKTTPGPVMQTTDAVLVCLQITPHCYLWYYQKLNMRKFIDKKNLNKAM